MTDEALTRAPLPLKARMRIAARQRAAWAQLLRFAIVGASGYLVNLAVFALALHSGRLDYRLASLAAFGVAVSNNFLWNRRWTFPGGAHAAHRQALRFLAVSVAAFVAGLAVLTGLVELAGVAELPAQAAAIVAVTPISFLANKLWSFRS